MEAGPLLGFRQSRPTQIWIPPRLLPASPLSHAGVDTHRSTILEQARPQSQWYSCWMIGTGSCTKSPAKKETGVRAQTLCTVPTSATPAETL